VQLNARLEGRSIAVKQEGGFGTVASSALRAVHQRAKWDGARMCWVYPYSPGSLYVLRETSDMLGASLLLDDQLRQQERTVLEETAREHGVRKMIQTYMDDENLPITPHVTQETPPPWRHQRIAFHWAMRVPNFYGALKPGLGKTRIGSDVIRGKVMKGLVEQPTHIEIPPAPSAVDPLKILPARWGISGGILITCPRVVVGEWIEQLAKWQNITALPITGDAQRKRKRAGTATWVHVCGYDSLESVEGNEYSGIIADEAHYISNEDSNRFSRMMKLRQYAQWVVALSGTPISNMLPSLWAQYYFLDYGRTLGPSYKYFKEKYMSFEGRKEIADEAAEHAVSKAISRVTMFLTMSDAFPGKPQKIHKVVRVPLTPEQTNYYERIRKQQATDVLTGKVSVSEALVRIGKLLQVVQGFVYDDNHVTQEFSAGKLKALEDMVTGKGELVGRRTLVWCYFDPEVSKIEAMLTRHKIKYLKLEAGMSDKQRDEMKKNWNTDASYQILIGKIDQGIGLNLHAPTCIDDRGQPAKCFTTVFYTLTWKVTVLEQAMDRVYRGDQTESCLYYYLLSDDLDSSDANGDPIKPIDVRVYNSLMAKLETAAGISETSIDYIRSLLAA
jgi:hypothetical protein